MVSTVSHGNVLDNFDKMSQSHEDFSGFCRPVARCAQCGIGQHHSWPRGGQLGLRALKHSQSGDTVRFVAGTVRWWPTLMPPSDRLNSRLRPEWIEF
jgi:hypothetical protein